MTKVNPREMDPRHRQECLDVLWTSIAKLNSREEVKNFFKDLLSESEAIMFGRRIIIAQNLLSGMTYDEITQDLKAGSDTIARVHQWLISGFGGYEEGLKRLDKEFKKRAESVIKKQKAGEPFSFKWLKKKYPLHFLLFNLFDELRNRK